MFGFTPLTNTPILLHDHNEFVNRARFLAGLAIYEKVVEAVANTPAFAAESSSPSAEAPTAAAEGGSA